MRKMAKFYSVLLVLVHVSMISEYNHTPERDNFSLTYNLKSIINLFTYFDLTTTGAMCTWDDWKCYDGVEGDEAQVLKTIKGNYSFNNLHPI